MQQTRLNENILVVRQTRNIRRVENIQIFNSYHIVCDVFKR